MIAEVITGIEITVPRSTALTMLFDELDWSKGLHVDDYLLEGIVTFTDKEDVIFRIRKRDDEQS